jgi:hypothetical protein
LKSILAQVQRDELLKPLPDDCKRDFG